MTPNLSEAKNLLHEGIKLVRLEHNSKKPAGVAWNKNFVTSIDDAATGYGIPLAENNLCSIDPDNYKLAVIGMRALGFDLEKLMSAGVRTKSTRPGSGGRSMFRAEPEIGWVRFASKENGIVLEFRAASPNLQDCVPGLVYADKNGELCTQTYANGKRISDAGGLPDDLYDWWSRMSNDLDFRREQEAKFFKAIGDSPKLSVSVKNKLAFDAPGIRSSFNKKHLVEGFLDRHHYTWHPKLKRWSHPTATGAPGIRQIPGTNDLWQSDHGGDALFGLFDAWTCFVVLDHDGNLESAISEVTKKRDQEFVQDVIDHPLAVDSFEPYKPKPGYEPDIVYPKTPINATEYVLDGILACGLVVLAAAPGAGKSTALVALALRVIGAVQDEFTPKVLRNVIFFTEHAQQIEEIIMAMVTAEKTISLSGSYEEIRKQIIVINAKRLSVEELDLCSQYVDDNNFTFLNKRGEKSYAARPWVIFDTVNSNLDLDSENDSQEVGKMLAKIKTEFYVKRNIPVLLSGHTSKALKHGDAESVSARGSGAFEADAHQVLYLTTDDRLRYLEIGTPKHRFHAKYDSLQLIAAYEEIMAIDCFGEMVPATVTYISEMKSVTKEDKEQAKELNKKKRDESRKTAKENEMRQNILDRLKNWPTLNQSLADAVIPTKTAVAQKVSGRPGDVMEVFETLLSEGHIECMEIDAEGRAKITEKTGKKLHHNINSYYWMKIRDEGFL